MLLQLPPQQLANLDVDTASACYVVEWVISRCNAENTTASTATLWPLGISPSFAPEILIMELQEETCPQVPWRPWNALRTDIRPLLSPSPLTSSPTPDPPRYHPNSPVYQPTMPGPMWSPNPQLQTPLSPMVPLTNRSLLLEEATPHHKEEAEPPMVAYRLPSLPPIVTLEEAFPISTNLLQTLPASP